MSYPSGHPGAPGVPPYPGHQSAPHPGYQSAPHPAQYAGYQAAPHVAAPGYSPAPGAQPPPIAATEEPSRGTVTAAGWMAILLGVLTVIAGWLWFYAALRIEDGLDRLANEAERAEMMQLRTIGAFEFLLALMWFVGGFLLLRRKPAGRIIVLVMCGFAILGGLVGIVLGLASGAVVTALGGMVNLVFAVITLCLALSGGSRRAPAPAVPHAQYPPYV
ncbi:hypothetical protein IU440_09820 [Nocardia cyriacigeorgica]|uniref:hypothetical protein n=1 Tax=Nocardia cyriacigeorgica TaxID=135487 RepID=UPI001893043B|nr:hypothetical protein [Nocardia cyriacigeorgica]MBF6424977.1 hypothetical protein [Nocardia cyriacigeorgica]